MVTKIYGTTVIPSDEITVTSGSTVAVSVAFARTAGLIGGMDTGTGTATEGDVVEVATAEDASELFGENSELHEQAKLAINNGTQELTAVGVSESSATDNFTAASGTLGNVPVFDPNVHGDHTITETNVGATVNIVYDDTPSAPSGPDEINLNPVNGNWTADASDTYDIEYDYGDYDAAITAMAADAPRIVCLLTENESLVNTLATTLNNKAQDFVFMHGVAGAAVVPDPTNAGTYTSGYTDGVDEFRISLVAPARGYDDDAVTNDVRTLGAVAGKLSSLPLGISGTQKSLGGLTGLRTDFSPTEAGELIDEQVMPLMEFAEINIVKDMTTSTDPRFERFYAVQVTDEVTELSHTIARNFLGDQNTDDNRASLEDSHTTFLQEMVSDTPALLDAYTVSVTENATNPNGVDIEIGIDIVDVIDTIKTRIVTGDVVQNGGVA